MASTETYTSVESIIDNNSSNYFEVGDITASNVNPKTVIKLPCDLKLIATMFHEFVKINNIHPGNNWDSVRVSLPAIDLYGLPLTNIIMRDYLTPAIESITKLKLTPSYCRLRKYFPGSLLKPHLDRSACQLSMSFCIEGPQWDINVGPELNPVELYPGKGIVYDGNKLLHGRLESAPGEIIQMFNHWIVTGGECEHAAYDHGKNREFFENAEVYGHDQRTYLTGQWPTTS